VKKNEINTRMREKIDREHYLDENGNPVTYSRQKRMNGGLIIILFIMICYGMVMLFSASMTEGFATQGNPMHFIQKQGLFTIVGIVIAISIAAFVPIRIFDNIAFVSILYIGTTFLLVATFIPTNSFLCGVSLNGARRWIRFLGIEQLQFQPTEAAKVALIFCFAGYTSWVKKKRDKGGLVAKTHNRQVWYEGLVDIIVPAMAIGLWVVLIILQPHISCLVIMAILTFFLFITAKIPARSWVSGCAMLIAILLVLVLVLIMVMPLLPEKVQNYVDFNYVLNRIAIFNDPTSVNKDDMFQTTQSLNAIGSGGVFGVGIGNSIQKWGYLPMQYNDYIFSIIAEELGIIGAGSVLLLFSIYLIIGVKIASKAATIYSSLIAFGYSILISLQAFLNIGVATKAIPPTGITLPFFSYGGTSTIFFFFAVGLLLCVSKSGVRIKK